MRAKFLEHIRGTLAIQPQPHSFKTSPNRWLSFGYALAGLLYMLRFAKNVRIQALATLVVIPIGLWLGLPALEWAILVLVIGLNWVAEFMNTALEAVVNLVTVEYHPMARVAKDIAAGAVLLTTLMALSIAMLLLLPPFIERIG